LSDEVKSIGAKAVARDVQSDADDYPGFDGPAIYELVGVKVAFNGGALMPADRDRFDINDDGWVEFWEVKREIKREFDGLAPEKIEMRSEKHFKRMHHYAKEGYDQQLKRGNYRPQRQGFLEGQTGEDNLKMAADVAAGFAIRSLAGGFDDLKGSGGISKLLKGSAFVAATTTLPATIYVELQKARDSGLDVNDEKVLLNIALTAAYETLIAAATVALSHSTGLLVASGTVAVSNVFVGPGTIASPILGTVGYIGGYLAGYMLADELREEIDIVKAKAVFWLYNEMQESKYEEQLAKQSSEQALPKPPVEVDAVELVPVGSITINEHNTQGLHGILKAWMAQNGRELPGPKDLKESQAAFLVGVFKAYNADNPALDNPHVLRPEIDTVNIPPIEMFDLALAAGEEVDAGVKDGPAVTELKRLGIGPYTELFSQ